MPSKGHDGGEMPGMGEPIMEMPLGIIGTEALNPTLMLMSNLPAIASLASSLAAFVLETDQTDRLTDWMYKAMCEKHRAEFPVGDLPEMLTAYKKVIDEYLTSLGMGEDGCSHD
jgi:hypothetical protein